MEYVVRVKGPALGPLRPFSADRRREKRIKRVRRKHPTKLVKAAACCLLSPPHDDDELDMGNSPHIPAACVLMRIKSTFGASTGHQEEVVSQLLQVLVHHLREEATQVTLTRPQSSWLSA